MPTERRRAFSARDATFRRFQACAVSKGFNRDDNRNSRHARVVQRRFWRVCCSTSVFFSSLSHAFIRSACKQRLNAPAHTLETFPSLALPSSSILNSFRFNYYPTLSSLTLIADSYNMYNFRSAAQNLKTSVRSKQCSREYGQANI